MEPQTIIITALTAVNIFTLIWVKVLSVHNESMLDALRKSNIALHSALLGLSTKDLSDEGKRAAVEVAHGCADYSMQDLALANKILSYLGYVVQDSQEPGSDLRAESLAQLLHDDPRVLPDLDAVEGDLLPRVGQKVFIHLASLDRWVEHTVVGYYVWPSLHKGDTAVHRVNVRVRDSEGYFNARMLRDVRTSMPEEVQHVPV